MDQEMKSPVTEKQFLIMTLILSEKKCQKFVRISKKQDILKGIIVWGKGTVNSATLNLLGIKSQIKEVISIIIEKARAKTALDFFSKELRLKEPGQGIAYTTFVNTANELINNRQATRETEQGMEEKNVFKKLTVIVNRGLADEVMDIARNFGVKGGTVLHGRGTGSEFAAKLFGVEIEPEKELVMILMPEQLVDRVVKGLYEGLQMDKPGSGILFVEPILEVRGLFDLQDKKE